MNKQCLSNASAGLKPSIEGADAGSSSLPTGGNRRLSEFLAAPARVQEAFDAAVARRLNIDLEVEHRVALDLADDPLASRLANNRAHLAAALGLINPTRVSVRWDERWSKRAKHTPKPGRIPYDRATDPLLLSDLRELWPHLTGEDVPRWGRVTCPHPDHEDRRPDCHVFADGWRCFGCNRYGDIIDLGSFLYGIAPRGSDFFRIRERLLDELGMEAAA